jgi:hypothetical protein
MQNLLANEKLIELKDLHRILPLKEIRAISKWCQNAGIKIQTIGNKRVVHRFLVDMELDKGLIAQLKKNYPEKWKELYKCYREGDHLGYLLLLEDSQENNDIPIPIPSLKKVQKRQKNTIKPKSNMAKEFAKL